MSPTRLLVFPVLSRTVWFEATFNQIFEEFRETDMSNGEGEVITQE